MDSADKHLQDYGFTLTIITRTNRFTGINITGTDKFTWANFEKALTSLEELHAVANNNETRTEETGLDTIE